MGIRAACVLGRTSPLPRFTQAGYPAAMLKSCGKMSFPEEVSTGAEKGIAAMNRLASAGAPFLFLIDAWARHWVVLESDVAENLGILWNLDGRGPMKGRIPAPLEFTFRVVPVERKRYRKAFTEVRRAQVAGETWLANLTFPSRLITELDLDTFALAADAPFRLLVPEKFAVFSPERFVRIDRFGGISSYPMKGTIDADLPDAAARLLADEKEAAEHVTIVDLIRNDIGRTAKEVRVPCFRYLSEVHALGRRLLQMSSEIRGELGPDWRKRTGDVLATLLPAGSVTGAPKKRTTEILRKAEKYERGWYTGIFGFFDGFELDSAVMIRFVERTEFGALVYKSGGGVTIYSDMDAEYKEMEAKIYAPFN